MAYKDMFTSNVEDSLNNLLQPNIVLAAKTLGESAWGHTKEEKLAACQTFLTNACGLYGVPVPEFRIVKGSVGRELYALTGGGSYDYIRNEIVLYKKFSLTTLLHEFRHMLQHKKQGLVILGDTEVDARGWSCSLFYMAFPEKYQAAADAGTLRFV